MKKRLRSYNFYGCGSLCREMQIRGCGLCQGIEFRNGKTKVVDRVGLVNQFVIRSGCKQSEFYQYDDFYRGNVIAKVNFV
jgi:hypothetical protein